MEQCKGKINSDSELNMCLSLLLSGISAGYTMKRLSQPEVYGRYGMKVDATTLYSYVIRD